MTMSPAIATDTATSRRFRRTAPALVMVGLVALIMLPGRVMQPADAPGGGGAVAHVVPAAH